VDLEESFEGTNPLRNALGVVQPIHPEHEALAALVLGAGDTAGLLIEEIEVDADWKDPDLRDPVSQLDDHRLAVDASAEQTLDAIEEVARVALDVEADQVAGEQAAKQLAVPGAEPKDVVGGEGNVHEEGDPLAERELTEVFGNEHQMVVVDPDQLSLACVLGGQPGEALVDLLVALPVPALETGQGGKGVEERPQGPVGEAVVVEGDLAVAQQNRHHVVVLHPGREAFARLDLDSGPADPGTAPPADHRLQSRDQPP
jgi:hypothetical protein